MYPIVSKTVCLLSYVYYNINVLLHDVKYTLFK